MSHTLHSEPVAAGDRVHDIVRGPGAVERLRPDGRIEVRFSIQRSLRVFDAAGRTSASDPITLYWHDPIVFVPEKSEAGYVQQRALAAALRDALRQHRIELKTET